MTKDFIICFAGGPFDGEAQEREYLGAVAERYGPREGNHRPIHVYIYNRIFGLPDGHHVAVASYSGVR